MQAWVWNRLQLYMPERQKKTEPSFILYFPRRRGRRRLIILTVQVAPSLFRHDLFFPPRLCPPDGISLLLLLFSSAVGLVPLPPSDRSSERAPALNILLVCARGRGGASEGGGGGGGSGSGHRTVRRSEVQAKQWVMNEAGATGQDPRRTMRKLSGRPSGRNLGHRDEKIPALLSIFELA